MRRNLGFVFLALIILVGCGEAKEIASLKSAAIAGCPVNIGKMVDAYMGEPEWGSGSHPEGALVTVSGKVRYGNRSASAVLEFVYREDNTFFAKSLHINGQAQAKDIMTQMLKLMCVAASQVQ